MVKKKVVKKAAPKAAPKVDKKYGYLPKDLQRAGQFMDRVAFLRRLQKAQADRQYVHVAGPGSGLSEHGAVDLGDKVAMVKSTLKGLVPKPPPPAPLASWSNFGRSERGRTRSPRAAAGSSTQPMVYDL